MDHLLEWRKEFPILEKTIYLVSHSLGAMPRRTADALQEFAQTWASRGVRAWEEGWWEMPVSVGDTISIKPGALGSFRLYAPSGIAIWVTRAR